MNTPTSIVLVGGGVASCAAAGTLRRKGYTGRLVLVSDEPHLPYERPPLSKDFLLGKASPDNVLVQSADWWDEQNVELRLGTRVEHVDTAARSLSLSDGAQLEYDRLLVATGGRARRIADFEVDQDRVFYLRGLDDATRLRDRLDEIRAQHGEEGHVAILGGGFIGCELAAAARIMGMKVTIIEAVDVLMQRSLGQRYGGAITEAHRRAGVDVLCHRSVTSVRPTPEALEIQTDSDTINAHALIISAGMVPNTDWLENSGIELQQGGVLVDEVCRSSVPEVFAAGDAACQQRPGAQSPRRVEHQDTAQRQGAVAAAAMLNENTPDLTPDWFWSDQYDLSIQATGQFDADAEHVVRGSIDELQFSAIQLENSRIVGALSVSLAADVRAARRLIAAGAQLDVTHLEDPKTRLKDHVSGGQSR